VIQALVKFGDADERAEVMTELSGTPWRPHFFSTLPLPCDLLALPWLTVIATSGL
jgi:hypothetical protein